MKTVMIKLDSIAKVREFVDVVTRYHGEVQLSEGEYMVNGRSLLGIFSLNLEQDLQLKIESEEHLEALLHDLEPYTVG